MCQEQPIQVQCDPITGLCELPDFKTNNKQVEWNDYEEIIYVGDPMCSWCWGISPQINALQRYANQEHIKFSMIMGGLRPNGGQEWDASFRSFLKHHWEEVHKKSGQPFNLSLFEREAFDYNTEPACRAVVTARTLAPLKTLAFYELVQYYFYAASKDPKQVDFYKPICEKLDMDFIKFSETFNSETLKQATEADFDNSRQLGIRGFPSVLYRKKDQFYSIANGYTEFEALKRAILEVQADKK